MRPASLILHEIRHGWFSFLLTTCCVTVAVGVIVAAMTVLRIDRIRTAELLEAREQAVDEAGRELEDSMRKITKGLGFNIVVLPAEQSLAELHADGTPSATMPETYVDKLAGSELMTVNHLLPIVTKRVSWPEMKRNVVLTGTRGEVPLAHKALKKPLQDAVPPGEMIVGYQLSQSDAGSRAIKAGDKVALMGREFRVSRVHDVRGNVDDVTVWINLAEAQKMLRLENLVHAILALECNCATVDRVAEIREDITTILPGTQVIERGPPALARAEARNQAKATAIENLATEKQNREALQQRRRRLVVVLIPAIVFVAATWTALLTLLNVRRRHSEIGVLRAIGLQTGQILVVLLGKPALAGCLGGLLGVMLGFVAGAAFSDSVGSLAELALWQPFLVCAVAAPLLSVAAAVLPATSAARTDPAAILAGNH